MTLPEQDTTPEPGNTPPTKRRLSPVVFLFLLFPILGVMAGLAMANSAGQQSRVNATPAAVTLPPMPTPRQVMGEVAPDFELVTLDGTTVKLSDYQGQVVFLNFWATWCEPCKRELPAFQAFMAEQPEDGAVVLAVDVGETHDVVNTYITDGGLSGFPVLLDAGSEVGDVYGISRLPTTFVIDGDGMIRFVKYGEMKSEDLTDYLSSLQG